MARRDEAARRGIAFEHLRVQRFPADAGVDRQPPHRPRILREDAEVVVQAFSEVGQRRVPDDDGVRDGVRKTGRIAAILLRQIGVRVVAVRERTPGPLEADFDVVRAGDVGRRGLNVVPRRVVRQLDGRGGLPAAEIEFGPRRIGEPVGGVAQLRDPFAVFVRVVLQVAREAGVDHQLVGHGRRPLRLEQYVDEVQYITGPFALYNQIFHSLIERMVSEPTTATRNARLIFIAKHLERIGDYVTDICELTVYMAEAAFIKHSN